MISEILKKWCIENNIDITDKQLISFEKYASLLKEWNEKMNLTAITDDEGIAVKHFIDSISVLKFISPTNESKIIDIGTGAGFPGIPLKIMRPDIKLTLLDSLKKRLIFLSEVCSQLDISAELIHSRAEDGSRDAKYREKYDIAISRAVANLPALCEYCLPYVKAGGKFISMKGPDAVSEIEASANAFNILGGNVENSFAASLPDGSSRIIISILKKSATPAKYPRKGTKISKNPL